MMQLRNGFGIIESLQPHYAGLELGYFAIRIERIDGQHVRGSLFEVKGENTLPRVMRLEAQAFSLGHPTRSHATCKVARTAWAPARWQRKSVQILMVVLVGGSKRRCG